MLNTEVLDESFASIGVKDNGILYEYYPVFGMLKNLFILF